MQKNAAAGHSESGEPFGSGAALPAGSRGSAAPLATPGSKPEWVDPDDAPELTDEYFEDAEYFQGETFIRRGRGRPKSENTKELVSIRLDPDVLAKLREAGPGWQTRVNDILRKAVLPRKSQGDFADPA